MSKLFDRMNNLQLGGEGGTRQDVGFFKLTEGEHRVRLVGEFVAAHTHWIAPSKFNKVKLYPEEAFNESEDGKRGLHKSVPCADFDVNLQMPSTEKTCTICALKKAAEALMRDTGLEAKDKQWLEGVAMACKKNTHYYFACIDRDDHEFKGFKIIDMPNALFEAFKNLAKTSDIEFTDDKEGVDLIISMKKAATKTNYAVAMAMKGISAAVTPLTEEELSWERPNIIKIKCGPADQQVLHDKLVPTLQTILDDSMGISGGF